MADAGEVIEIARIPLDELAEKLAPLLIDRFGKLAQKSGVDLAEDTVDAAGSVVTSRAALALGATDGFLYIPTMAGPPSGVPTAHAGTVALVFDTANNDLYVYDGGWIKVHLA